MNPFRRFAALFRAAEVGAHNCHPIFFETLGDRTLLSGGPSIDSVVGSEGNDTTITVSASPLGEEGHGEYQLDWGDGGGPEYFTLNFDNLSVNLSHVYNDDGNFPLSLMQGDGTGQYSGEMIGGIFIANEAPYADLTSLLYEDREDFLVGLANVTDSAADLSAGIHYMFAGTFDELGTNYSQATDFPYEWFSGTEGHDYLAWARAIDKDGGYRDYNRTMKLADLAVTTVSPTSLNLTFQDIRPGAQSYRIQRSSDGQEFEIYKNIGRADLTFANGMITWTDTAVPEGTKMYYRARAVDDSGAGNDTAYSPKKSRYTMPLKPVDVWATNLDNETHDIEVRWTNKSTHADHVIVRMYSDAESTDPVQEIVLDGDANEYTFADPGSNPTYCFTVEAVCGSVGAYLMSGGGGGEGESSGSSASGQTPKVESLDEPEQTWTDVVWYSGQQNAHVSVTWTDERVMNNGTMTMTLEGLPRHTYAQIGGYIQIDGPAVENMNAEQFHIEVDGVPLWVGPKDDQYNGNNPSSIHEQFAFGVGRETAFKHEKKTLTLTITASGFHDWRSWAPSVFGGVYFPFVSIQGSGTTIEDGSALANFKVHRTGEGTVLSEPLTVNIHATGTTLEDSATEGVDYEAINEIVIPAGEVDGSKDVTPIDDPDAEGVESIYQTVKPDKLYALAAPPATNPATNETAGKVNGDDDPSVHQSNFEFYVDAEWPKKKAVNGLRFANRIRIQGEHLDQVRWLQLIKTENYIWNYDGTPKSQADVDLILGGPNDHRMNHTDGEWKTELMMNNQGQMVEMTPLVLDVDPTSSNGKAVTSPADGHRTTLAYLGNAGQKYTWRAYAQYHFDAIFMRASDNHLVNDKPEFTWGFEFSNQSYEWKAPAAPVALCASPFVNGTPAAIITGYGSGFDPNGIQYVEDINQ